MEGAEMTTALLLSAGVVVLAVLAYRGRAGRSRSAAAVRRRNQRLAGGDPYRGVRPPFGYRGGGSGEGDGGGALYGGDAGGSGGGGGGGE
jgi:hypothetical protein